MVTIYVVAMCWVLGPAAGTCNVVRSTDFYENPIVSLAACEQLRRMYDPKNPDDGKPVPGMTVTYTCLKHEIQAWGPAR